MNDKILVEQIDQNYLHSAEIFRCSLNKNHLVEDPLMCQGSQCQQLICKLCMLHYLWRVSKMQHANKH